MHQPPKTQTQDIIAYYKDHDMEIKHCRGYSYATKPHLHHELSIGIIKKGETTLTIAGKPHTFKANDAIVIYPGTSHLCRPMPDHPFEFIMMYIKPNEPSPTGFGWVSLSEERMALMTSMLEAIMAGKEIENKMRELKESVKKMMAEPMTQVVLRPSQPMRQIEQFIVQHTEDTLPLRFVSEKFNTDPYTLIRHFKKMMNTTPSAYKQQVRLSKAKALLYSNLSIAEVTYVAGYYDQPHFVRHFKAVYGLSPSLYRKKLNRDIDTAL